MPEITYPTPNPQSIRGVNVLLNLASSGEIADLLIFFG
jgi:hypothetical protein